jgi:hypothetical protein
VLSRFLTMTRTAKRGISNAAAMAACAVCLVAAAVIVMVPVLALAHRQADLPPPFRAPVDRVSSDAAWDAARVSDVALADVCSQWSPARAGQLGDIDRAGRLDVGLLLGVHVPADARWDARADTAADAERDSLGNVRSRHGQADVILGPSVAGPLHPFRRVAGPWMRVAHAGDHAAAIPAVGTEWHASVTPTRLVRLVDAFGRRLPVGSTIRNQVRPTSQLARSESHVLGAGCLCGHAFQLTTAACGSEPDSARAPSPSPEKWTLEVSDQIRFYFVGCSLIA